MVQKYLGFTHEYGKMDCIELIRQFYKNELDIEFGLPAYPASREWMKHFSCENVDGWAAVYGQKVKLTDAQNYDVIAYKSLKSDLIIHFGLFIQPTRMLHIEEGGVSRVEYLSEYWMSRLHAVYRHNDMV